MRAGIAATSRCRSAEATRASATEIAFARLIEPRLRDDLLLEQRLLPLEFLARGFERRLRLGDLRLDHRDLGRALAAEHICELRFGAGFFRLRLVDGTLRLRRVEPEEKVARRDRAAALNRTLDDASADLGRDIDEVAFDIALEGIFRRTAACGEQRER